MTSRLRPADAPVHQRTAIALALAALFISCPAWADDAVAPVAGDPLQSVVVTATRSAIDISDAPAAVTVVTQREIEGKNVSRISDALLKVPSLFLGRGENGQSSSFEAGYSLRGLETRRTLVLLNGLQPLQNGNSQSVNWLAVFVDDVERVEVVPGAFASLYGSNAMGGIINVIGKRPDRYELKLRLQKGYGDAGGTDSSIYFRNKFDNGLGIAAGLSYKDRSGYISEYVVRSAVTGAAGAPVTGAIATVTREGLPAYIVGDRGLLPWRQSHAMVKFSYDLSPQVQLYAGYAYADAVSGYTRFNSYLRDAGGAPVSSGTLGINGQRFALTESLFAGSTPLTENSKRWYAGLERQFDGDARFKIDFAGVDQVQRFPTVGSASTWNGGPGSLTASPNTGLDATATLSLPLGARHAFVGGLSVHRDTVTRTSSQLASWRQLDTVTGVNNIYDGRSTTTSAFAQDEFAAADRLKIYAGARLDRWETVGDFTQMIAPVVATAYPSRGQTSFNPKVSAVFKADSAVTLRASIGRSFRAPSNLDLYSTTVQNSSVSPTGLLTIQSDPHLKPERGTSWETGGEWRVSEKIKASATYYATELSDLIYSQQVDLSLTQRINAGKATIKGLEAGLSAHPWSWLELNTNASWIHSEIVENRVDPGSVGARLTQVPARLAYAGLSATQGAWSAALETRYSGQTYSTAHNTDIVMGVPSSNDAFTMVNTKLGYQAGKMIRLNLMVNNLLNRAVYQFGRLPGRNATVEAVLSL